MIQTYQKYIPTTKDSRTIRVFIPETCSNEQPCDVLFMHDAQNIFDDALSYHEVSWRVIEGLKKANIKHLMVVGIDNSPTHRLDEYSPYETSIPDKDAFIKGRGGLGKIYLNWLVSDILPWVQQTFPVTTNYYMAGSSMGAYISMFAAMYYPNLFKGIGSFSIASWFNEDAFLKDLEKATIPKDTKFYVSVGKKETSADQIKEFPQIYINNSKHVVDMLKQKGVRDIHFNLNDGAHNERQWMELFPEFASFMFKR